MNDGHANHHHDTPWYEDAIFYGVDLARFYDSDANGYGDFDGLIAKLDYIADMGFNAIWLVPFYRSPREDDGYDVTDHYEIDPRLGDTGSFVAFLREAECRGIKILIDLVINHTSIEHRWFQDSRRPGSRRRDWYVWVEDLDHVPAYEPVFPPNQISTWTRDEVTHAWYLHHFHSFEPDLNTACPEVQEEIRNMVEYWIRLGVRGFRVDGAYFLGQKLHKRPEEAFKVLHDIHHCAEEIKENTVLLPEVDLERDELAAYTECDDVQMLFNFHVNKRVIFALATGQVGPLRDAITSLPDGGIFLRWLNFLRHNDELTIAYLPQEQQKQIYAAFAPEPGMRIYERGIRRRLAPMLNGDRRRMQLAFGLMFAVPGIPLVMAGDEIGMGENLDLPERDAARLPMQWTPERPNGGFSDANPDALVTPVLTDGPFGIEHVNVQDQQRDDGSFLNWMRRLIAVRKAEGAFFQGGFPTVLTPSPTTIALIYPHAKNGTSLVALYNCAGDDTTLRCTHGRQLIVERVEHDSERATVTLGPFGFAWWEQQGEVSIESPWSSSRTAETVPA